MVDDDTLKKFEIHPGDVVFALGYPFGQEANDAGFPILRSGWIASYPLLPSREVKKFLLTSDMFGGNSGGPVYFVESTRTFGGSTTIGTIHFLIGLVTQEVFLQQPGVSYPIGIATVVPSSLIKDTIQMLPAP